MKKMRIKKENWKWLEMNRNKEKLMKVDRKMGKSEKVQKEEWNEWKQREINGNKLKWWRKGRNEKDKMKKMKKKWKKGNRDEKR